MTDTFSDHHSDSRILVLSALGSLMLHGLFMAGLAFMPESQTVKDDPPTVQVTLLPAPQISDSSHTPTPPLQPRASMQKALAPPSPPTRPNRSQSPAPPLQASLTPPPAVTSSLLPPPISAKPILKDTRASRALKARNMMKMRVPLQAGPTSPSLPSTTRIEAATRHRPPIPSHTRKQRSATTILPALPPLAQFQTLRATPQADTGSSISRPAIISSSKPAYPRVARESGWEGTVIVRVLVDTKGLPREITLQKSCGHSTLDQAAQDAVKNWKFHPAKDGNIPIRKRVDIPIKFDLNS